MAGGVINGEPVDQSVTNNAFIIKNADDTMPNKLGFTRPSGSGPSVADIQLSVNNIYTATGVSETHSGTDYNATPNTISNGENYQSALAALADKFDAATGHRHTGQPGDAPAISGGLITNVPLTQIVEQGTQFTASSSSNDVSSLLSTKTPSSSSTSAGVIVNNPQNRVSILSSAYDEVCDASGNLVYGRLTYSTGVWTLSYYSLVSGIETAYSFPSSTIIQWFYKELFQPLISTPVYQPLGGFEISYKSVHSLAASGSSALFGDVVLQASGGMSVFKSGQNIVLYASPSAGIAGYTTTATSGGTTTLTLASTEQQYFTGTSTQTVVLPVVSTLTLGQSFTIVNLSTNSVTVQSSGGNVIQVMMANTQLVVTVISTSGTGASSWSPLYQALNLTAPVTPTIQKFTSGSGTYTTPAGVKWIRVEMVGGGGGGSGSGAGSGTGTSGGNTTFGTTLLVANGGGGGAGASFGGTGGTASLGSGPIGIAITGAQGSMAQLTAATGTALCGAAGAQTPFGGAGYGAFNNNNGGDAVANTGSGGGGGGGQNAGGAYAGSGGGAGGYVNAIIASPSSTYSYAVGASSSGGTAGAAGSAGGGGAAGIIIVTEYYYDVQINNAGAVPAGQFLAGPTSGSSAAPTFRALQTPTNQTFTSGSGTYTTPAGVLYITVEMVGGGGGGQGSGTSPGAGTDGGNTTFGTTFLTCNGGLKGSSTTGGSASGGDINITGSNGGAAAGATNNPGGFGGSSPFGGAGIGQSQQNGGVATGYGSGGAGGGTIATVNTGGGGGAGGYLRKQINSPSATYSYAVGAAGSGGSAGTSGAAGGNGQAGIIIVREFYQ